MPDHEYFPGARQWQDRVHVLEKERDVRRRARVVHAHERSPREHVLALDAVSVRMIENAAKTPEQRGGAFAVLSDEDLGIIERALGDAAGLGQLKILDFHTAAIQHLALLRANLLSGQTLVDGPMFRKIARMIYEDLLDLIIPFTRSGATEPRSPVIVVPWRAGLIGAEVFRQYGIQPWAFWHLGMKRNEHTLDAETYFDSASDPMLRDRYHLVCDPMLATGNTNAAIIRRLIAAGVSPERIINFALIAAPEGVFRLLYDPDFKGLRVVTLTLDGHLDERGYITDPGLGDFGDYALNDVGIEYAEERWLKTNLLTQEMIDVILGRTAEVRTALAMQAPAPA